MKQDTIEIPVQINGKVKAKIQASPDLTKEDLIAAAKADPRVAELVGGKQLVKEIAVPGRMVNLVVKG